MSNFEREQQLRDEDRRAERHDALMALVAVILLLVGLGVLS